MKPDNLSILIIDEDEIRSAVIERGLREAGYAQLTIVNDLEGVARKIARVTPDVIVIDLGNPKREMLENMFKLSRAVQRPIAMFVDQSDQAAMDEAIEAGISAYVVDGLKKERVTPVLELAISRFNAYSRMAQELEDTRNKLKERTHVDRAKGILMKAHQLSEDEAYARLRTTAMNQNRKISQVAEGLVLAAGLLDG